MNGYVCLTRITVCSLILLELSFIYANHYTDKWAVHILGGERVARDVASQYSFIYLGQIMPDYYHFQHRKVAKRSVYPSSYHHRNLAKDKNVKWLEQQVVKRRVKRDIHFNDPKWPRMWYLKQGQGVDMNVREAWGKGVMVTIAIREKRSLKMEVKKNRGQGVDMNVREAWSLGYTGKGVVVTILDDGIETDHPDLSRNYDIEASYDVNGHDPDPQPRYDFSNENRHGTRCAGEVAAQADNHFCSVGVAFDARIGGVRMLDGDVTDSVEAQSLSLNPQHIHVYSASWGPDDDGRTVDGPATLARKAFYDGITRGRGGLGSIFVWASGNGGRDRDSCNCDGYTNSIYTLSISSATEKGHIPWYSEACSSTLATTYSSGSSEEKQIVTTDLRKSCTESHTGTSASAPLAAGLCALALQANSKLSWRDMQHLVVMTAKPGNLHATDWKRNGVGRQVSHSFGYGLMDAASMVRVARNWTTIPPQHICDIRSQDHKRVIPMNGKITVPLYTDGCEGKSNYVRYLEHVEAKVTLTSSRRGEILIYLTSPMGTKSTLLDKRLRDTSREGFNTWAFMTTHSWGEYAKGTWILEIENGASISELKEWSLVVMGSATHPQSHNYSPPIILPGVAQNTHQLPDCAGVSSQGVCIECQLGYYKLDLECTKQCPSGYYGVMVMSESLPKVIPSSPDTSALWNVSNMRPHGVCKSCDTACATCRGPENNQCFSCSLSYSLVGNVCEDRGIFSFINSKNWAYIVLPIVLCICLFIVFGVIFLLLQMRSKNLWCWKEQRRRFIDLSKGHYNGISISTADLESDFDDDTDINDSDVADSGSAITTVPAFGRVFNGGPTVGDVLNGRASVGRV